MMRFLSMIVLSSLLSLRIFAQTFPTTQQIESDLAGPYAATEAQPSLQYHGEISRRVERILVQQSRYLVSTLHPWDHDPDALLLTDGGSAEAQIRPNAHTAYGLAVLYRVAPDDAFTGDFTRQIARDRALAILRFLLPTHGAGGVKLRDGKLWHNQWQSALWAYSAGQACWLMWDNLSPQQRWLAARMICDEADRFIDATPPMQIISDTKAEENAWDSQIISLAYCIFPNHPHHARYREAAIRWIINSFPTHADEKRSDMFDGKPLSQWLVGANLHEDYTLENHDRVHPDYMSCTTMCMFQKLNFQWANEKPPDALDLNVEKIYADSKILTFPDGGYVYPNGQDWQLHRNADWFDYHCGVAVEYNDPQATRFMRIVLETAEKMAARNPNGPIVGPDETIFASTQHFILEGYARSYLLLRAQGEGPAPEPEESLWEDLAGLHVFDSGQFAILRTEHAIATFSWGRQIMGMVLPLRKDLLVSPDTQSLIGSIDGDTAQLRSFRRTDIPDTLTICVALDRGASAVKKGAATTRHDEPRLLQQIGFVALPDGRVVFVEAVSLVSDIKPKSMKLASLPILNDPHWVYHDGKRTIYYAGGKHMFNAADANQGSPREMYSRWLNVDNAMGIVVLADSGSEVYAPHPSRGASRLQQMLYLNAVSQDVIDSAKRGDMIARTAAVFYPGQKSVDTPAASSRCGISGDPMHPIVTLDDLTVVNFDLDQQTIAIQEP